MRSMVDSFLRVRVRRRVRGRDKVRVRAKARVRDRVKVCSTYSSVDDREILC